MDKKRILIVEDEPNVVRSLSDLLKAQGYEVLTALDGKAGIETVKKERLDLVLLDVMMPRISGIEFLQVIKGETKYAHIPVIVITAKSDTETLRSAMANYADKYITKPYNPQDVLDSIKTALKSYSV